MNPVDYLRRERPAISQARVEKPGGTLHPEMLAKFITSTLQYNQLNRKLQVIFSE